MTRVILLAAALALQDAPTVPVGKSAAAPYRSALEKYQTAKDALQQGDVTTAFDLATEIIEDVKILAERRECYLKIQNPDSTWRQPQEFFPVKLHATAQMARARKQIDAGNKEDGVAKLQSAAKELDESIGRNVPGAKELKAEIEALIEKHSSNEEDPVVKRRRAYEAKVGEAQTAEIQGDFSRAKTLFEEALGIDAEGAKAREGLDRVKRRIAEEAAFEKLKAIPDADAGKIAACDEFLKQYPVGARRGEVLALRERLTKALVESEAKREAELKNAWLDLKSQDRYRSAMNLLAEKGGFLKPDVRRDLEQQTRTACDSHIASETTRFRINLADVNSVAVLRGKPAASLDRDFRLPAAAELLSTSRELDWCRSYRTCMDAVRALPADAAPDAVLDQIGAPWAASALLVERGENPWFRSVTSLIRDLLEARLRDLVRRSKSAAGDELKAIKQEAASLLAKLDGLDARLTETLSTTADKGASWRQANGGWARLLSELKAYPAEFPVDAAEIEDAAARLSDWKDPEGVYGKAPRGALSRIESDLSQIWQQKGTTLSLDARRRLFTTAAIAGALRHLLDGRKTSEVPALLSTYAAQLKACGGPVAGEAARFGPKVERILAGLTK